MLRYTLRVLQDTDPRAALAELRRELLAAGIERADDIADAAWPTISAIAQRHTNPTVYARDSQPEKTANSARELSGPGYRIAITSVPETASERRQAALRARLRDFWQRLRPSSG